MQRFIKESNVKLKNLWLIGLVGIGAANAEVLIPSGSPFSAIITTGASLSKSTTEVNPVPLALQVTDGQLQGCSVIVSAVADWSADRAKVRLTKFICNGKELDAQGWVVGSDNKAGIANVTHSAKLMNINAGTKVKVVLSQALSYQNNTDSFITTQNTNPAVTEYFTKMFNSHVQAIYNTKYPDTYAIKLENKQESNVIVYGNMHSKTILVGAGFNESSPYYKPIINSFKFQGCQQ